MLDAYVIIMLWGNGLYFYPVNQQPILFPSAQLNPDYAPAKSRTSLSLLGVP